MNMGSDQLQVIASLISDRMDEFDELVDVYVQGRKIDFGYEGVQYALSFWFDEVTGYNTTLENYAVEVDLPAVAVGRMLRGDFVDLEPFVNLP